MLLPIILLTTKKIKRALRELYYFNTSRIKPTSLKNAPTTRLTRILTYYQAPPVWSRDLPCQLQGRGESA